jgi:site-specific DNA-methyltransferase (adenine-specific)
MKIDDILNTVIQDDCLNIMRQLPDKCVDLVLTDPPYGLDINKSNRLVKEKGWKYNKWDKKIPDKIYFDEIFRISKNQIIWGGNYFIDYLYKTKCYLIWDKNNDGRDFAESEFAWTSFGTVARTIRLRPQNMDYGKVHPTQKPEKIFKECVFKYSEIGMTIFDPFAGSGTTAIACLETGRNYILIEKEPDYIDIINNRIELWKEQVRMF